MSELNLLPCPMPDCGSALVGTGRLPCGVVTVSCGHCGTSIPATDEASAEWRWNNARRATQPASAPAERSMSEAQNAMPEAASGVAAIAAPAALPDWITYDAPNDIVTIHAIKYRGELLRDFGNAMPVGQLFELVSRANGALAVCRVDRTAIAAPQGQAEPVNNDALQLMWDAALSDAAFYVAGHCANGEHHAEAILGMARPAVKVAEPVATDWTVEHSQLARKILMFMGYSGTTSLEPGADQFADRLAEKLAGWLAAPAQPTQAAITRESGSSTSAGASAITLESGAAQPTQAVERDAWVSVAERLPEAGARVWVAHLFRYSNAPAKHSVGQAIYTGQFWLDGGGNALNKPTHWMLNDAPDAPAIAAMTKEAAPPGATSK